MQRRLLCRGLRSFPVVWRRLPVTVSTGPRSKRLTTVCNHAVNPESKGIQKLRIEGVSFVQCEDLPPRVIAVLLLFSSTVPKDGSATAGFPLRNVKPVAS